MTQEQAPNFTNGNLPELFHNNTSSFVSQPIHRTATARLAVDTTFTMETSISRNLWGT